MADKIIAPIALALFLAFVVFLPVYVMEVDLWIVILAVAAMALVDFWQALRSNNGNGSRPRQS